MTKFFRLPDHISDLPPPAAARLECARRAALDCLLAHDYALHIPALAEYADTLSAGDETLQLDIFKMTDTISGRTLGIRADHTPQTARFDAARGGDAPRRLCYCGPALRTRPPQPWKCREIMQLGAEIFNLPSPAAEWEIIRLAAMATAAAGIDDIAIDIGHAGIINLLLGDFAPARRATLCRHISRHDIAVLQEKAGAAAPPLIALLQAEDAPQDARKIIAAAGLDAGAMFDELEEIVAMLRAEGFDVKINFGEIGGYGYHTGVVFSIYADTFVAARGGRYDRPEFRPAVGFSMDLREIVEHLPPAKSPPAAVACHPQTQDPAWRAAVATLRAQNRRLRFAAANETLPPPLLEKIDGAWKVRES